MQAVKPVSINTLARESVKAIVPYASARRSMSGGNVWLNANENALAPSYSVSNCYNRYPECQPPAVINAYAAYSGLSAEQILVSRGADEGIELLIRSFCEPGVDDIIICPPTYGMYAISAQTQQVAINTIALQADFTLDMPALREAAAAKRTKLVFICSPNNPTGDLIPRAQIEEVLQLFAGQALVVLDEAYIEFAPAASVIDLLPQQPHLVILRTLSKAFGLAGLRCGFTLAAPDIINALKQVIAPYPLAAPVAEIAAQALSADGIDRMWQQAGIINQLRDDFIKFAKQLAGVRAVYPSNANYVLLQVDDAAAVVNALAEQGILIRNQSSQIGLSQVVRVSIGSPTEMDALQQQLSTLLGAV